MLAKAERLDGKGEVEGHFYYELDINYIIPLELAFGNTEIKPETLKYKVSDQWFTKAEIEDALKYY